MKTPHLLPAASALLVVAAALTGGWFHARRVERRAIAALVAEGEPNLSMLARRRALQEAALHRHDLLPLYGSSEVLVPDPYHARELFRTYPTGFRPAPFGQRGACCLIQLVKLGALGRELRGHKVVVSFTSGNFLHETLRADAYAGNFSRIDANEFAFSTGLSFRVKRYAAGRMLRYPETLDGDPLLRFGLDHLAGDTAADRALYLASLPLGRLQCLLLRLNDHWETICSLKEHPPHGQAARRPGDMDWSALTEEAGQALRQRIGAQSLGVSTGPDSQSPDMLLSRAGPENRDALFRRWLDQSREWDDLHALLVTLREQGAQPLLLSTPIHGTWFDRTGVSAEGRRVFYDRLEALAGAHGVPLADFADHDDDPDFLIDFGHLTSKGWVYYARALDDFYHAPGAGSRAGDAFAAGGRRPRLGRSGP
jgi:D-alanine transfer protein